MKKKIICVVAAMLLISLAACGSRPTAEDFAFEPYADFTGAPKAQALSLDAGITLDGVLSENVWTESTPMKLRGVAKDQTTNQNINNNVYGARSAEVYTYVGEKNVYFAFDVKDKNLYYNAHGEQALGTCVELYFANATNTKMGNGCYSIRVSPTGKSGDGGADAQIYVSNGDKNDWRLSTAEEGMYAVAVKVDGKVCSNPNDSSYSTKKNKGYVVEIAVSKALIGKNVKEIRYTAAFVQDKGFSKTRLGNSFISGTTYNNPNTWLVPKNKGSKK